MGAYENAPRFVRFDAFELDLRSGELRRDTVKIKLQEQPFRILATLLEHAGEVVTREELQQKLWPGGTFVDFEHSLNAAVKRLREALGDSATCPRFVETVPRHGYRFVGSLDNGYRSLERSDRSRWLWPAAALVAVMGALIGYDLLDSRPRLVLRTIPLTSFPGEELTPALSPDGNQVAFLWKTEGSKNPDLYVKLIDDGNAVQLTNSPEYEDSPTWSPDGRRIAFLRWKEIGRSADVHVVPALGGPERKLTSVTAYFEGLSWSPDGKSLAIVDRGSPERPDAIFLLSIETGTKKRITTPPETSNGDLFPTFSPDGQTVGFVRHRVAGQADIYLTASSGGRARRLTSDEYDVFGLAWTSDGDSIVFSSNRGSRGHGKLWKVSAMGGEPERLAEGDDYAFRPSISRLGNRLAYQRRMADVNIWRMPGPNATDRSGRSAKFIASTGTDAHPSFSPDGQRIVFTSNRSGQNQIYVCDRNGTGSYQVNSPESRPNNIGGRLSPGGERIAFVSGENGNLDIYVVETNGGKARRLTINPSKDKFPSWSRDGRWIYFLSDRYLGLGVTAHKASTAKRRNQVWKIPAEGPAGEAVPVTTCGGAQALESPCGDFIFYTKSSEIWRTPVDGGDEIQFLDEGTWGWWDVYDDGICFVDRDAASGPAIGCYSFSTRETKQLAVLDSIPEARERGFGVSPDGQWILYTQEDLSVSDLVLVENLH